jgi:UDP-glucose 4-epimerase
MADSGAPESVLVVGGAGFIGSHIAAAFARRGVRVSVLDGFLSESAREANLAPVADRVQLIRARIEEYPDAPDLIRGSSLTVDCMGLTGHHIGMAEPLRDLELNLRSHLVLIEALRKVGGARVIYLGSRGQYGRAGADPITEETQQVPLDPQGVHKLAAEGLFRLYSGRNEFHAVSLRVSNTFGEYQRTRGYDLGMVGSFLRDLLDGRTVTIFGDSSRARSLVYVRDLAEIVVALAARRWEGFDAYNVAGCPVELGTLMDALVAAVGAGAWKVEPFPERLKQIDVGEAFISQDKLVRTLGSVPSTALATALSKTVDYFRSDDRCL